MAAIGISSLASYFSDEPKSLQRGENHFKSDHVESFSYYPGEITGVVRASMKSKSYKVVVYMDEKAIKRSTCECPRGDYKCSHAAALIIFGIHHISRTDVECKWRQLKPAAEVTSVEKMYPPRSVDYNPLARAVRDDDCDWFSRRLKGCGQFTGMYWILSPEPEPSTQSLPVPTVEELILSPAFVNAEMKVDFLLELMRLNSEQRSAAEVKTRGQRNNPSWHLLRRGRLTASNFGVVLRAKRATPSLMKRLMGTYDLSRVKAVNWGIVNEEEAVKAFKATTNMDVEESGIWLTESGVLGASPDGLVGSSAILEVKCPFTERNSTMDEAVKRKDFYLTKDETAAYKLKENHVYWHQVQGQLHITGRDTCHFTAWTSKESVHLAIQRDERWSDNIRYLENFHKEHILPKLISGGD